MKSAMGTVSVKGSRGILDRKSCVGEEKERARLDFRFGRNRSMFALTGKGQRDESIERRLGNWMKGRRMGMGHQEGASGEGKTRGDEKEDHKCLCVQKKSKKP